MMQTRVTLAPSGAANGLDNASTSKMSGSRVLESGHGALDKGDFAALVTKAQSCEQGTGDAVSSSHGLAVGSDKGLAPGSEAIKDEVIDEREPDADKKEEGAKAGDFLLQLQDALKLDTSLVTTALVPALSMAIAVPEDGNLLPPTEINVAEEGESTFAPAAGSAAKAQAECALASTLASLTTLDSSATANALLATVPGIATEGEDPSSITSAAEKGSQQGAAVMGDSVAQVITGLQPASTAHSNVQSMLSQLTPVPGDRSGAPVITAATPAATPAVTQAEPQAQSAELISEVEGLTSPLAVSPSGEQHNPDELALTSLGGGNRLTTVASAVTQAKPQAQSAELISEVEGLTSPLAVTPSGEQHNADELAPAPQAGEEEQGLLAIPSAKESEQSQTVPAGQSSQQQLGDNRLSGVEGTVRREPQQLPHLKLAGQDAPAELYQKVNLMLADKLQQVEIQLDPLGLGKMKIQIQIGADSQANVHFVVQHGQTREMLEHAMPRLRDMLAGQGIQLGQAQVEQQAQQQQQGKPSFNGQGQSGQGGSQAHAGSSSGEGDITTSTLSVLVESTNSSGIDFYA